MPILSEGMVGLECKVQGFCSEHLKVMTLPNQQKLDVSSASRFFPEHFWFFLTDCKPHYDSVVAGPGSMGITRSDLHKRKKTGGKKRIHRKKRKFELGRPPAMTKLVSGEKRVHHVRTRGGNRKFRALRLSGGVFSWGSEVLT